MTGWSVFDCGEQSCGFVSVQQFHTKGIVFYDCIDIFLLRGPTEPVHCLSGYGSELISGTTANRIGVHTAVDAHASFSSTRLRSDTFKGVLTAMAVLPLNRLLLLGADTGNISLLC